jgi:hypothetical protein
MMMNKFSRQIFAALLSLTLLASTAAASVHPGCAPSLAAAFTVPAATSFSTTVPASRQSLVQLQGSDAEGTSLVYATTSSPTHGALSNLNTATGYVVYTPTANFVGADSFTYTVTSGGETSSAGTVTISVTNAKTTVTGTITDASGNPRSGKVTFILTQAVTTPAGLTPVGSSVAAPLSSSGAFSIQIYPSRSMSPVGYYQVLFNDSSTGGSERLGVYDIPASTIPISLSAYQVANTTLAQIYTFASLAGLEALTAGVSNAAVAQLMSASRTTGRLQKWDGANLADTILSDDGATATVGGALTATGTVTAQKFIGDGSQLSGITGVTGGVSNAGMTTIASTGARVVLSTNSTERLSIDNDGTLHFNSLEAYYAQRAALLEPDALETFKSGTFTYAVASNVTKYLIASWYTKLDSAGRFEVRNPAQPFALRGVTLSGLSASPISTAITLDPSLPTYTAAMQTYFDRLKLLDQLPTRHIDLTTQNQRQLFLPGPYGSILTRAVNFDFTWVIACLNASACVNLANEISDADVHRTDNPLLMPVNKFVINNIQSGTGATVDGIPALGQVTYVNLPSTWSKVADPNTYSFRDDFMGATLNTGSTWTRAQSTAGNVEIESAFSWLKLIGNSNWGTNGAYSQTSIARASGKKFLTDMYANTSDALIAVGFSAGTGHSYTNYAHTVVCDVASNSLTVYENGTSRGTVGAGCAQDTSYRVRITLSGSAAATYDIQGGAYAALGGSSWTSITPGTSSSATTNLRAGATIYSGTAYVGDVRIF